VLSLRRDGGFYLEVVATVQSIASARKLALQRARRAASPRIDYMPSPKVWRAIEKRRRDGATLSAIVDEMILASGRMGRSAVNKLAQPKPPLGPAKKYDFARY
jgi:hypothetical protein